MSPDEESAISGIKARLRSLGWYVRYAEWPSGHQVVIHRRSDTAVHRVTRWWPAELQAWSDALAQALAMREEAVMSTPIQEQPESTVGRKPPGTRREPEQVGVPGRSGTAIRREEGDETEAGSEIHRREIRDPETARDLE